MAWGGVILLFLCQRPRRCREGITVMQLKSFGRMQLRLHNPAYFIDLLVKGILSFRILFVVDRCGELIGRVNVRRIVSSQVKKQTDRIEVGKTV